MKLQPRHDPSPAPVLTTLRPRSVQSESPLIHTVDYAHPYMLGRGLTAEQWQAFGIGVYDHRLLFPVHCPYGSFVNFVGRHLDATEPKYDFSLVSKSQYLFNYHRARSVRRKAVIVVEGFVDTLKVHYAGYPSVVSLMGSAMSERQMQLLLRWWEYVILMMDGDRTGQDAQEAHFKRLTGQGLQGLYRVKLPATIQPDMLNPAQIQQVLATAA